MNLYTPARKSPITTVFKPRQIKSHTVYLATLEAANPDAPKDFKLVTTIAHDGQKLFVLSHVGMFYLSDNYILGEGMANILYSSVKLKRVMDYGSKLILQQPK